MDCSELELISFTVACVPGTIQVAQESTAHQPGEVGDLVGFLEGPSGQGEHSARLAFRRSLSLGGIW